MNIKNTLRKVLSIPKSLYFNLYYLPLSQAIYMPLRVSHDVIVGKMGNRNAVRIKNVREKINIGFSASYALGGKTYWEIGENGSIIFNGSATLGKGTQVIVDGVLDVGSRFYCNADCIINSGKCIKFGNDVLVGWKVTFLDGDGHYMIDNIGNHIEKYGSIDIGEHVWIASDSTILKDSHIYSGSVVAYGSIISKDMEKLGTLIGGTNRILKENINWEK